MNSSININPFTITLSKLTTHIVEDKYGGYIVNIFGAKEEQLKFIVWLANKLKCITPTEQSPETIIWKAQRNSIDVWNTFPKSKTVIFVHKNDQDTLIFNNNDLPDIKLYTTTNNLYSQLEIGKINIVYQPSQYKMSNKVKKILSKHSNLDFTQLDFWWQDFIFWLRDEKPDNNFISLILQNYEQIIPKPSNDLQWNGNLLFKDIIKSIRRTNTSIITLCDDPKLLDPRVHYGLEKTVYLSGVEMFYDRLCDSKRLRNKKINNGEFCLTFSYKYKCYKYKETKLKFIKVIDHEDEK